MINRQNRLWLRFNRNRWSKVIVANKAKDKNYPQSYYNIGKYFYDIDNYEKSIEYLMQVYEMNPK